MSIASIKHTLRSGSYFVPFRMHFLLVLVAFGVGAQWLLQRNTLPDSSNMAILTLFVRVIVWFLGTMLAISFLTTLVPFLLFLLNRRNGRISIQIKTTVNDKEVSSGQAVNIKVHPILRPLLGFIRLRLEYDENNISPKFTLINNLPQQSLIPTTLSGVYNWPLTAIKEYKVNRVMIYFEDLLQFFSFTTEVSVHDSFFIHPSNNLSPKIAVQPKKTEQTNIRIDEMRKVEGEFLNYKNFENNDDVRRIVWKIYAKNKELVIRVPETSDPYASHVYFYASFYNALSSDLYEDFNSIFLNYFKTKVWNAWFQLNRQNVQVKYIADQETGKTFSDDIIQKVKYQVSTSNWQNKNDLLHYFNKRDASVLCISSLTDPDQLKQILEETGNDLTLIFVPVSESLKSPKITDWLKWIFIRPEPEGLDNLRLAWNLAPIKKKILENEMNIIRLIHQNGKTIAET